MTEANFFVPGPAPTKGSTRSFVHRTTGRVVTLPDNRRLGPWTRFASLIARAARPTGWSLDGPFAVRVCVLLARPRDRRARGRAFPVVKPDADKTARAALDLCTGLFWHDDAQVVDVHSCKRYGAAQGTAWGEGMRIVIRPLTEADL